MVGYLEPWWGITYVRSPLSPLLMGMENERMHPYIQPVLITMWQALKIHQ